MWKNKWFQWIFWGLGVVLMVVSNFAVFDTINDRIRAQNYQIFLDITTEAEMDIQNRLRFYEEILWGGVGLFNASNEVERSEWVSYSQALELDRYPGINGVGYIEKVDKKDLPEFIRKSREEYPGYKRSIAGDIKVDDRFMILYISPEDKNAEAIGLDIGTEKNRRQAAIKALNTGKAVMTEPIILVQDEEQNPGFLILLPVYKDKVKLRTIAERKESFVGWVYAPFIAKNFLQDTLHTDNYLGFSIHCTGSTPMEIYSADREHSTEKSFRARSQISLGETTWSVEWWSKPGLADRFSSYGLSRLSLFLGLVVTFFVTLISGVLLWRDQRSRYRAKQLQSSFEESESKFAEAFDNAAIGICLVSPKGRFLRVNNSLCEMLGYSPAELIKKTFQDITHPDDLEIDLVNVQKVLDGKIKTYTLEKRYFHKRGKTIWIRLNVSLVRDNKGNPKFFVSQIENITRTKLLDDIKSDFVSITSHQFRTPLSGMRWNLESLLDGGIRKYAPRKIKLILTDILESVLRMNELVKDLLRVSKLESGLMKAELRAVDTKKVLRRVVKELKPFAEEKNQKIVVRRTAVPAIARADEGFVSEVFKILIHNAINYSPDHSDIVIEFEIRKRYFYLHVENEGTPIPRKEQKRLFEKFSRLQHGVQRNPNGSGLGLFIAQNLSELMGGDVRHDKTKTDRIRFTVKFNSVKG